MGRVTVGSSQRGRWEEVRSEWLVWMCGGVSAAEVCEWERVGSARGSRVSVASEGVLSAGAYFQSLVGSFAG
ncbi:unnamed protein product [Sphagnum balticum]